MRPIHLAQLDRLRPAVVLTREAVRPWMSRVTVVLITTRIRGLSTEVPVGRANGINEESVANCDNIATINVADLGRRLGELFPEQEAQLTAAIQAAFALE